MNARRSALFAALVGAGWLALFGDKTPADSAIAQLPPRVTPSAPTAPTAIAATAGTTATTANTATNATTANPMRTANAGPVAVAARRDGEFDAPIPRDRLIAPNRDRAARDLFAGRSWAPPPAPVVQAAPEPAAPAGPPPLPFAYVGKKWEAEQWEIYLGMNDQNLIVRTGSTIENAWRVDRIDPPNIVFIYLPSGHTRTLAIGEPQ